MQEATKDVRGFGKSLHDLSTAERATGSQATQAAAAQATLRKATLEAGQAARVAATSYTTMIRSMSGLGSAAVNGATAAGQAITRQIVGAAQRAQAAVGRLAGSLRGIAGGVGRAASGLATLAGVVGAVFTVGAIRNAISYEKQLQTINTIAMVSTEEIYGLGQELQHIAITGARSIADVTEAMYQFQSAGIGRSASFTVFDQSTGHLKQTKDAIQQTTGALAAATNLSVGALSTETEAVTLLSFALNAFNLNQSSLTKKQAIQAGVFNENANGAKVFGTSMQSAAEIMSDQFAKAVEIGVVKASQIASSFQNVAAAASAAGIGVDEIAAAYAAQTTRGVTASRVTTSMQRAIQDLIKPGKTLTEVMEKTGKNYADIARTQGIHVALQEMRTDAANLGIDYVKLFKRQEGWRFALNITSKDINDAGGNYQLYLRVLDQIHKSTGTAADQTAKLSDTVSLNADRVRIAFGILQSVVGTPLLKPLNDFLKQVIAIEIKMIDWANANQKVVGQLFPIIGAVTALLSLTAGTQGLLFVLSRVAPVIGTTGTGLSGLARLMARFMFPLAILTAAFGAFGLLVSHQVAGFGRFATQLGTMQALMYDIGQVFATVGKSIGWVITTLRRGGDVGAVFAMAMDDIGQAVENMLPTLGKVLGFVASFALALGRAMLEGLGKVIPAIAGWAEGVVKTIAPVLLRAGAYLVFWVEDAIPKVIGALGRFFGEVTDNIGQHIPGIIAVVGQIANGIAAWFISAIPTVLDAVGTMVARVGDFLSNNGPGIIDAVAQWFGGVARWFANDALPAIAGALGRFIGEVEDWFRSNNVLRQITEGVLTWGGAIIVGLFAMAGQIGQWVVSNAGWISDQIISGIADFLVHAGPKLALAAVVIAGSFLKALAEAIISDPGVLVNVVVLLFAASAIHAAIVGAARLHGLLYVRTAATGIGGAATVQGPIGRALTAVWTSVTGPIAARAGSMAGTAYLKALYLGDRIGAVLDAAWTSIKSGAGILRKAITDSAIYQAGLQRGQAVGQALTTWWARGTATGGAAAAGAGGAHGTIYGLAFSAKAALGNFRTALLGGVGGIQQQYFASGTMAGQIFGRAMALAVAAGTVLLAAEIARNISPQLNNIGVSIHKAIFGAAGDDPLSGIGRWLENLPWPWGPKNAPEWAGGNKPIEIGWRLNQLKPIGENPLGPDFLDQRGGGGLGPLGKNEGLFKGLNIGAKVDVGNDPLGLDALRSDYEKSVADFNSSSSAIDLTGIWVDPVKQARQDVRDSLDGMSGDLITATDDTAAKVREIQGTVVKSQKTRIVEARRIRNALSAKLTEARDKGDLTGARELEKQLAQAQSVISALKSEQAVTDATLAGTVGQSTPGQSLLEKETALAKAETDALAAARRLHEERTKRLFEPAQRDTFKPTPTMPRTSRPSTTAAHRSGPALSARLADTSSSITKVVNAAIRNLDLLPTASEKAGKRSASRLGAGVTASGHVAIDAITGLKRRVSAALHGINTFGEGAHIGAGLAQGLRSQADAVRSAARRLAAIIYDNLHTSSPAKEGPLSLNGGPEFWGTKIPMSFGMGMLASLSLAQKASVALAGAFSDGLAGAFSDGLAANASLTFAGALAGGPNTNAMLTGGTREIAPFMSKGGSSGGVNDRVVMQRQTELLGEIAGATRIGAAASARSATRDPRASGPLAARSTLQSLKHLSVSRTRGG